MLHMDPLRREKTAMMRLLFYCFIERMGISGSQYGLSTAAGLFKSVISILLVAIGNKLSKKLTGEEVL